MSEYENGFLYFISSLFADPNFLLLFLCLFIVLANIFWHDSLSALTSSNKKTVERFKEHKRKYVYYKNNNDLKKANKIRKKMRSIKNIRRKCLLLRCENMFWSLSNALVFSFFIITPFYLYLTK